MTTHASDIVTDDDGWIIPRCTCGWIWGACPDNETAIDVLMEHVADVSKGDPQQEEQDEQHTGTND